MSASPLPLLLCAAFAFSAAGAAETLQVFPLFSDHGTLQQDTRAPVWGTAAPGSAITVSFAAGEARATADAQGAWLARIRTPKAEPGRMEGSDLTIAAGGERLVLHDVAMGEVWIGSGQSNIDTPMSAYPVGIAEAAKADHPGIRLFSGGGRAMTAGFAGQRWEPCAPATAAKASATGYFFSHDLQQALRVPVGFINLPWAGSALATWVLPEWLEADPRTAGHLAEFRAGFPAFIAARTQRIAAWQAAVAAAKAEGRPAPPRPFSDDADAPIGHFIGAHVATHTAAAMPFACRGLLWTRASPASASGSRAATTTSSTSCCATCARASAAICRWCTARCPRAAAGDPPSTSWTRPAACRWRACPWRIRRRYRHGRAASSPASPASPTPSCACRRCRPASWPSPGTCRQTSIRRTRTSTARASA